jgi:hypothetical protein
MRHKPIALIANQKAIFGVHAQDFSRISTQERRCAMDSQDLEHLHFFRDDEQAPNRVPFRNAGKTRFADHSRM